MLPYWLLRLLLVIATVHCEMEQNDYYGDAFADDSQFAWDMTESESDKNEMADEFFHDDENDETGDMSSFPYKEGFASPFSDDDDDDDDDDAFDMGENDDGNDEKDDDQDDGSQLIETLDDENENDVDDSRDEDDANGNSKRFLLWALGRRQRRRRRRPRILKLRKCIRNVCKNGGQCLTPGRRKFKCKCRKGFIGKKCQWKFQDACVRNPCRNGGKCIRRGLRRYCRCRPRFGGKLCQNSYRKVCLARGDPHYKTFDNRWFDWQGECEHLFAKDCGTSSKFSIFAKNVRCGRSRVSCVDQVKIFIADLEIQFMYRTRRLIINGVYEVLPYERKGVSIRGSCKRSLVLTTDFGLTVKMNGNGRELRVILTKRFQTCGLCGNNNGRPKDDVGQLKCQSPKPVCQKKPAEVKKCDYLETGSPFKACHARLNPKFFVRECQYDACLCDNPMDCVCKAVGAYVEACALRNIFIDWRFKGTNLFKPLDACEQKCDNPGEIFKECSSTCLRTCRDLSKTDCQENCVPRCQCPEGKLLNDQLQCISIESCPCPYEGTLIASGEVVDVGKCTKCTCVSGLMNCKKENKGCKEGPCDGRPCKNEGLCTEKGSSFECECQRAWQGDTCEDPAPRPCDSSPCKNGGICTNNGYSSYTCECEEGFQGKNCEGPTESPCESNPCKNGAKCIDEGMSYFCICVGFFKGDNCEIPIPQPCNSNPCENGGSCVNAEDTFRCVCKENYEGDKCETPVPPNNPCDPNPCLNGGTCSSEGDSFFCKCTPKFVGKTCEKELPDPCKENPCQNGGTCKVLAGTKFTCTCKPEFGGRLCEYEQSECSARGDPHYISFDKRRFDFMGKCDYEFASDCQNGDESMFAVYTKNVACGRRVSCVSAVRMVLLGHVIKFTRQQYVAIVDNVLYTKFPITRKGLTITNPSGTWLRLESDIGLTVSWNGRGHITVKVSGKFKNKMCGLCGNNNGNAQDDKLDPDIPCIPPPEEECVATVERKAIMDKCDLMGSSPFSSCDSVVDRSDVVENCKYDACRCDNPMECVCKAFAAYTKACSAHGRIINWRFKGTFLVNELAKCEKTCENGEVFTECGSSVAETCEDLSRTVTSCTECVPGCQCSEGKVRNNEGVCIPKADCYCEHGDKIILPGENVDVSKCVTCTCSSGTLVCIEDKQCATGPCDSMPCENNGVCAAVGDTDFTCDCEDDFIGKTCNEPKPEPCDSQPCQNGGTCSNKDDGYVCLCTQEYNGTECQDAVPKPCDSSPCKNEGQCVDEGDSFRCICEGDYDGDTCEDLKCRGVEIDLAYVVDSSGSLQVSGFDKLKEFLKGLNEHFDIDKEATNVGIIEFSRDVELILKFEDGTTRQNVNDAITNMKYMNSFTFTTSALKMAREKLFTSDSFARCAAKVLILLTDGGASVEIDPENRRPEEEAALLKKSGVTIVTVGIGEEETVDEFRDELKRIASKSETTGKELFYEATLESLDKISNELVKQSCSALNECTPS